MSGPLRQIQRHDRPAILQVQIRSCRVRIATNTARVFGIFSMLALALSAVGLYSVVSYAVAVMAWLAPARRAASIDPMDAVRHEQPAVLANRRRSTYSL